MPTLYRQFGRTGLEVSVLGFGCMRLPTLDDGGIDEPEAIRMIRHAIDNGVNYIDTAWPYHKEKGELLVGKALQDGYRERVFLATKSPVYLVKEPADFDKYLNLQLEKLQTKHIDFYLLHALNGQRWQDCKEQQVFDFIQRAKADGRIKYIGFSFHDKVEVFKQIIDEYDWDFCQIQLNYMNEEYQAGLEGLRYAAGRGLPVVIMEPLLGGKLARAGKELQRIWDSAPVKRSPAAWALRWLWNMPEVTVVLSGMSTMNQVQENLSIAGEALPNSLTPEELQVIAKAREFYLSRIQVDCTGCDYCADCPSQVRISSIFSLHNQAYMYEDHETARAHYRRLMEAERDASRCIQCAQCEGLCPQNLEIRRLLQEIHQRYKFA